MGVAYKSSEFQRLAGENKKKNDTVDYPIQIYNNTEFIGFEINDNGLYRFLKIQTHLQFYDGWEIQITSQLST